MDQNKSAEPDPEVNKILTDARQVLHEHHKMSVHNTIYNPDRSIKQRDAICFCGYTGPDQWSVHVVEKLMDVGLRPMTTGDIADITLARIR